MAACLQRRSPQKAALAAGSLALAIVHTCMYDAWAAYDERAVGTQLGGPLRRPASERTLANKERVISYATYRALVDVLPVDTNSVYIPLMKQLGYDPNDHDGEGLFGLACANDLEGIVAKRKSDPYLPEHASWLKIRNQSYSQWVGREELFERERGRDPDFQVWDGCALACAVTQM